MVAIDRLQINNQITTMETLLKRVSVSVFDQFPVQRNNGIGFVNCKLSFTFEFGKK